LKPFLGIDFGTSTARAALAIDQDIRLVEHAGGASAIPSAVALPPAAAGGGPPLVGHATDTVTVRYPERTISGVKRLLGRRLESPEVRHHRQTVPYELVAAKNGDVRIRVGRRHHAPQDIAAYVMGTLRAAAERQIDAAVTDAVLVVPALFNDLQRRAVCDAARIAGLDVKALLTESTAVVLGSGLYPAQKGEERKVLVYALGGGSFEVTTLEIGDRGVEVVACGGDSFLGGDDFDQRIVAYVCEEVLKAGGDLRRDRGAMVRLKHDAARAKIDLSTVDITDLQLGAVPGHGPITMHLDRSRLEKLTQDLVDRTVWSCESVLRDAKWSVGDVDIVVLAGGQSRMPRIRAQLGEMFGKPPVAVDALDAEVMAAVGAARHAAAIAGGGRGRARARGGSVVTELTTLSLGLESAGGVFTRLIPRGTSLPTTRSQAFSTPVDGQTQIVIHLLQGEREMASDNESVARVQVGPLPPRPRGGIQIEVEIGTDGGGLPTVVARDVETGELKAVRVRPTGGLTDAEVAALAIVHAGGPVAAAGGLVSEMSPLDDVTVADGEPDMRVHDGADPTVQGG
jgi:molecular chaperone DnaK